MAATPTQPGLSPGRFLADLFGPVSEGEVWVASLPNSDAVERETGERSYMGRDPEAIDRFCAKWDRKDRGLFFSVGTVKPGTLKKTKDALQELALLHADVDLKDIEIGIDEVLARITGLFVRPSILVRSGRGVHAYWLLREGMEATPEAIETVEAALRQLSGVVGGDAVCCQASCYMRLPGTHNTKGGAWTEVEIVEAGMIRHELDDILEWLDWQGPIIARKAKEPRATTASQHDNPFLAVAERLGFKPPIDVEQRLAVMSYQGAGDAAIHSTQLQVSASLLTRGTEPAEVVAILLDATQAAAGEAGSRWNWRREERAIQRMCDDWLRKNPQPVRLVSSQPKQTEPAAPAAGDEERADGTTGATVHSLGEARARKTRDKGTPAPDGGKIPVVVADGVVEAIRQDGGDILLSEGEVWLYHDGLWSAMTAADEQWLKTLIQQGCDAMGRSGDTKVASAAWKRLTEHPDLFRRHVPWDRADMLVARNGMLDLKSREFRSFDPDLFARRKVGVEFRPGAACPKFLGFLASCFGNLDAEALTATIAVLQDFFGSALAIRTLSREQRKALMLHGPSRTGKTQVATVVRRLIGDPVAAPSIMDVSKEFGLQALYGARAWIRDDAINESDQLDPARFKTIVTGEPVDVNRKGKSYVTTSFEIPVVLTTNALPRARDASDAIYNRCIVIEMTNVIDEETAEIERRRLGVSSLAVLADALVEEEGPGILNWALDGLDRIRERGRYDLPENIRQSIQRFKDTNNPVAEWARTALVRADRHKVTKADLLCAYHGWQKEEHGDEAKALGSRSLLKLLRSAAPWADTEVKTEGVRFVGGIRLTDEGLALWQAHKDDGLRNGSAGSSGGKAEVNKVWRAAKGEEEPNAALF